MNVTCEIAWRHSPVDGRSAKDYSREHRWSFDGGTIIDASASPDIVPVPMSNPMHVDPEEAILAAAASCHMLFFLHLATAAGFQVRAYDDAPAAVLGQDAEGDLALISICLHPKVTFEGASPDADETRVLHDMAHERCIIARSMRTPITIDAVLGQSQSVA
ncbi:MAG: OsmC family protein [Geminicoccaceae bacterium]